MKLIEDKTGREIQKGDTVTSFRGEKTEVISLEEPKHDGSTGRVHTKLGRFYPSVFNLKWVP